MRFFASLCFILLLAISPAAAELSAKAVEYLKEIGIDAAAPRVQAIASETVSDRHGRLISLETLALEKDAHGIRRFIATRNFLRAYQADSNTRIPSADDYEASFLTSEERAAVRPAFRKAGDELYLNSLKQKN